MSSIGGVIEEIVSKRYTYPSNSDRLFVANVMLILAKQDYAEDPRLVLLSKVMDIEEHIRKTKNES
jgi:hypothetical protein